MNKYLYQTARLVIHRCLHTVDVADSLYRVFHLKKLYMVRIATAAPSVFLKRDWPCVISRYDHIAKKPRLKFEKPTLTDPDAMNVAMTTDRNHPMIGILGGWKM